MFKLWGLLIGMGMLVNVYGGEAPAKTVKFISHRGESSLAPENTLAAFKMSQERGSDGMECDIDITRDGVVIVSHDNTTERLGDKNISIRKSTWEELKGVKIVKRTPGLNAFPNEGFPQFKDTLRFLGKDREYYVEFKGGSRELVAKTLQIIKDAGIAPEQIVVISFNDSALKFTKEIMPQIKTLWLTFFNDRNKKARASAKIPEEKAAIKADFHPTVAEIIAKLKALKADGVDFQGNSQAVTSEFVAELHQAGYLCGVWTVEQPESAKYFIKCGVDSITSNRASALKKLYQQGKLQ